MQNIKRWIRRSNSAGSQSSSSQASSPTSPSSPVAANATTLAGSSSGPSSGTTTTWTGHQRSHSPPAIIASQPLSATLPPLVASGSTSAPGPRSVAQSPTRESSAVASSSATFDMVPVHRYNTRQRSRDQPQEVQTMDLDSVPAVLSSGSVGLTRAKSLTIQMDVDVDVPAEVLQKSIQGLQAALDASVPRADSPTDSAFDLEDEECRIDFLSTLPYELAVHVLTFLPTAGDLCNASLVSRSWYALTRDNEIWKVQFVERWVKPFPLGVILSTAPNPSTSSSVLPTLQPPLPPPLPLTEPRLVQRGLISSELAQPQDYRTLYSQRLQLNNNWKDNAADCRRVEGHADSVYCVQFDDETILSGSRDRTIKWWDMRNGRNYRTVRGHEGSVLCLQYNANVAVPFSPSEGREYSTSNGLVVSGSSDSTMMLWDFASGERIGILRGHGSPVLDVRFDNNTIVSCSKDCTIKIWNLDVDGNDNLGSVRRTLEGHHAAVNAVYLHRNLVASASGDCTVKLWDLNTGSCIREFLGHSRGLACVQFDGRVIVSGSNDKSVKVWDARAGTCIRTLDGSFGHTELVRTLAFDNERIISGSYDQAIKVWDLRATGQENKPMLDLKEAHSSWVFHVQMSARRIVSASQDRKIVVWDFGRGITDAWKFV